MPFDGDFDRLDDEGEVVGVRDDARQAEDRTRRIVGVDRHPDADLLGDRNHLAQKSREVLAQARRVDVPVPLEHPAQPGDVVALVGARQAGHDGGEKLAAVRFGGAVEPGLSPPQRVGRMVRFGARPFEHEAVEGRVFMRVEAQGRAAAGQRMRELRSRPVEHGHEVVADRRDAAAGEVAQGEPVIVEERPEIAFAELDGFVNRQALGDAPAQAERRVGRDQRLSRLDLLDGPDDAVRDVVQSGDDPRRSGLPDVSELDDIVRTEPAPGLFHGYSLVGMPEPTRPARVARPAAASAGPRIRRRSPSMNRPPGGQAIARRRPR